MLGKRGGSDKHNACLLSLQSWNAIIKPVNTGSSSKGYECSKYRDAPVPSEAASEAKKKRASLSRALMGDFQGSGV